MTAAAPRPPTAPKFPRGGLRSLEPGQLEDESVYRGVVLEGLDLSGTRLHAVAFEGAVFREVRVLGAQWTHLRLRDVRFEDCDLSGAVWPGASLERVAFSGSRMLGTQLPEARLRHVRLTRVQAPLSLWFRADSAGFWAEASDLNEATFMEAKLPGAVFRACRLTRTDFLGAALPGADLRGSELGRTRLGLRELEGVTVEPVQLLDLAHVLGVRVAELDAVP